MPPNNRKKNGAPAAQPSAAAKPAAATQSQSARDRHLVDLEIQQTVLQTRYEQLQGDWQLFATSRHRLKVLYESMPVGLLALDDKGQIIEWNSTAARMLNRRRWEPRRVPFAMFVMLPDVEIFLNHLRRCRRAEIPDVGRAETPDVGPAEIPDVGRAPVVCELRLKESGGLLVQLVSTPFRTLEGRFFQTALIDLTERKKNERTVEEAKEFSDTIIETIREPLVVLDAGLRIVRVNHSFSELFLKKHAPLISQSFEVALNLWWSGTELRNRLNQALSQNLPLNNFEMEVALRDKGHRVFLFNARRLHGKEYSAPLLLVAMEDITERKHAEIKLAVSNEQLKALNNELESRVAARTKELLESNRQLEGFCYSIAHDLRAPLRAMAYFSDCLASRHGPSLPPEGKDFTARIAASSRRMGRLIDDLLEFGRFSTAQFVRSVIDPDPVLDEIIVHLQPEIERVGAQIERRTRISSVLAHPAVLQTAFLNLLGNALKFVNPSVTPRITIWEEVLADHVRIWVEDNGIGIAREHHRRIFNAFERLQAAENYPGNGIGLAVVSKALERIDGAVGVESKVGKGSRFWLDIPRAR